MLDTHAFSDLMREHPKVDAHLASLSSVERVMICTVVRGEIRYGIERLPQGRRRQELSQSYQALCHASLRAGARSSR